MTESENNHAKQNAEAWYETIREQLHELKVTTLAGTGDDDIRDDILSSALEIAIRDGWHAPGSAGEPAEFYILLTTGGPGLRLRGSLDRWNEPTDCALEYQDWGTPWEPLAGAAPVVLEQWARCFYFGD